MKKIRKTIRIEDFMKLWDNIDKKNWDKVMPDFWDGTKQEWIDEIGKRFTQLKKGGSYGNVNDFILKVLLRNTENTFLPRSMDYHPKYARDYPITYVKTGFLKGEMSNVASYEEIREKDKIGIRVNIPMKPDPEEYEGYMELEQKRSFIKSSFVLAWPKILQKALESIGS